MRYFKMSIVVVAVFCLVTSAFSAEWVSKRLTNNTGASTYSDVAASGENVYVVWEDDTPGNIEVFFRMSVDDGGTWQAAKRLTYTTGNSCYPDVAVSGDNVYVVWEDGTVGNPEVYFRKSSDNGASWQAAKRLTDTTNCSYTPQIAVSGANIYIVWQETVSGYGAVWFLKSIDGGAHWQPMKMLTDNLHDTRNPALAVSGANVYMAWSDLTPGNYDIYFRMSADSGATWQGKKRISNNTGHSLTPHIAGKGANVYIAWEDRTPGNPEIYFRKSADNGATWLTAQRITNNIGGSCLGNIALRQSTLFLVWEDDSSGNHDIFMRQSANGGSSWQAAKQLTNNAGYSEDPAAAVNDTNVFVVWEDTTPGNQEIFIKLAAI